MIWLRCEPVPDDLANNDDGVLERFLPLSIGGKRLTGITPDNSSNDFLIDGSVNCRLEAIMFALDAFLDAGMRNKRLFA